MVSNANELIFFLGAGASKPFGIPTMRELTEKIKTDLSGDELNIYNNIFENFKKDNKIEIDIEGILSVIQYLLDDKNSNSSDILNFYFSKDKDFNGNNNQYDLTGLLNLKQELFGLIRRYCTRPYDSELVYDVYSNFFNKISENIGGSYNVDSSIKYDDSWTIFTTNYDIILETLWKEYTTKKLFAGFMYDKFSPDYYLYTSDSEVYRKNLDHRIIRLVKLHGSVSWLIKKDTDDVIEKEFNLDEAKRFGKGSLYVDEVMMYPLLEKNLYQSPYIQMFYNLDQEWKSKRVCIAIGYSFRDSIIRNILSSHLKKNKNKKIILIDPNSKDIVNNKFNGLNDQIIPIERGFGNSDYRDVNEVIKEIILSA